MAVLSRSRLCVVDAGPKTPRKNLKGPARARFDQLVRRAKHLAVPGKCKHCKLPITRMSLTEHPSGGLARVDFFCDGCDLGSSRSALITPSFYTPDIETRCMQRSDTCVARWKPHRCRTCPISWRANWKQRPSRTTRTEASMPGGKGRRRWRGRYRSAVKDWSEVLAIAKASADRKLTARATGELAILAFLQGRMHDARPMIATAILEAKTLHDVGAEIR